MTRKKNAQSHRPESGINTLSEKAQTGNSSRANWYFILFFFVWAFILYGNTILNQFAIDDEFAVTNDQVRRGLSAIPEIFTTHYVNETGNISQNRSDYRPIVKLTYALEYAINGQDKPGRNHAVNVLIYFLLSTLLFFVLKRMMKQYNILFPFLITVVFMAHPVHTEAVASLKNRDELLAFLFGLWTLLMFLKYADTGKIRYLIIAPFLFLIGYLSKSSILPFILIYPLVLYYFTRLSPKKYMPFVLLIVLVAIAAQLGPKLFLPAGERFTSPMENPLFGEAGWLYRLGTGLVSLLFYLRILVYPHPLLFYYGFDTIPMVTPLNLMAILSLLLYSGMLIYAIMNFRRKNLLSFAILWYLIFIAMYSNFLIPVVGIVGERFVFAASLGFCIALIYAIFRIFKTEPNSLTIEFDSRVKILVVAILILIPYTAMTITRNREWRNLFDLYRKDIPYLENSAKANTQYAGYLMKTVYDDPNFRQYGTVNEFKLDQIKTHFLKSLAIYPGNYQTMNDLGTVYLFFGKDPDSAIIFLKRAIDLNQSLEPAWVNLGMAYRERKQYDSAAWCYSSILRKNPQQIRAYFALANVYNDMGYMDRAIEMNVKVLETFPNLDVPYLNIGNYYLEAGDTTQAVQFYEKAVHNRPSFEGCIHLKNLFTKLGNPEKAAYYENMAAQTSP